MPKLLLILILNFSLISCGGGSDSDDSDAVSLDSGINACSVFGRNEKVTSRIINGQSCSGSGSVVRLRIVDFEGLTVGFCSGTVIASREILTAAHCFSEGVSILTILTPSENIPAESVAIHPSFFDLELTGEFDVAIVKSRKDLSIPPSPILVSQQAVPDEEAIIAGFGLDENENSGTFRAGKMIISAVRSDGIIANFDGSTSNTCLGDSGGPLFINNAGSFIQAGITSSGVVDDCGPGDISRFTNLSNVRVNSFIFEFAPGAVGL